MIKSLLSALALAATVSAVKFNTSFESDKSSSALHYREYYPDNLTVGSFYGRDGPSFKDILIGLDLESDDSIEKNNPTGKQTRYSMEEAKDYLQNFWTLRKIPITVEWGFVEMEFGREPFVD